MDYDWDMHFLTIYFAIVIRIHFTTTKEEVTVVQRLNKVVMAVNVTNNVNA